LRTIKFITFIQKSVKKLGTRLTYSTLLMWYAYKSEHTPIWAKRIILGTLAYLISPFDSVPDMTPLLGFTDDLGVISFGLVTIACYINTDIRAMAKNKMHTLFKEIDENEIAIVDALL